MRTAPRRGFRRKCWCWSIPRLHAHLAGIDNKLQDVEFQLISHADALSDEKYDSEAARLYLNFLWLNLSLGSGTGGFPASVNPSVARRGLVSGPRFLLEAAPLS